MKTRPAEPHPVNDAPERVTATKERLFASAGELFRTKGFAATTTREIAASLGIQKATLYHHIRRKEDLLFELCLNSLDHMAAGVDEILAEDGEPVELLRRLIEAHMSTALLERDQHVVMLMELRSLPPEERATVLDRRRAYEERIEKLIAAGQKSKALRNDISSSDLRLALLSMLNWTIFWFRPDGSHSPEELGRLYADIFIGGATNPKGVATERRPAARAKSSKR